MPDPALRSCISTRAWAAPGRARRCPDEITARRAASLAEVAESAAGDGRDPIYIIGTEVPVPGGAQHALELPRSTRPEAALRTVEAHRRAFTALGLEKAFARAIGVVVQPGVEFSARQGGCLPTGKGAESRGLTGQNAGLRVRSPLHRLPASRGPRRSGSDEIFAILKVGPWLTFALREALYGLEFDRSGALCRAR